MPRRRPTGEVRVGKIRELRHELAVRDRRLAERDGVVEVVGGLRGRVVVERHPVLGRDGLGRDEAARVARLPDPEPALGGAVAVVVDAGASGVVDDDDEPRAARDRGRGRDHELVRRALRPVQVELLVRVRRRQLGCACGRERVVLRAADRRQLTGGVRAGIGIVLAVRVTGVSGLGEGEARRPSVHEH